MSAKVQGWVWDLDVAPQPKLILLWLANRATDAGVCFPGQAEIRQKTGLSESMVRRYLHCLSSEVDESGCPTQPLVRVIQRPIAGDRHTSNVYVLRVPWAEPGVVEQELQELKHVPSAAVRLLGCIHAPQWVAPVHPRWGSPATPRNRHFRTGTGNTPPYPPPTSTGSGSSKGV